MKRIRLHKSGLPLWDVRVSGDGTIWGEMIGRDHKCRTLSGATTPDELQALAHPPPHVPELGDDYRTNETDIIVTVRRDDPADEQVFLLASVPAGSDFRKHSEELITRLIEREAEQQPRTLR